MYTRSLEVSALELPMPELSAHEFESVAVPHLASLLRFALRLTGNVAIAEDLVQETMLSGWRGFRKFQPGTNCKAWLFKILTNLRSKQIGRLKRQPEPMDIEGHLHTLAMNETLSRQAEVRAAFDTLSSEHKAVLFFAVVEGFSISEIADILQLPAGTVMSRLSRARAALRQILQPGLTPKETS